jgi:hypothetical protein
VSIALDAFFTAQSFRLNSKKGTVSTIKISFSVYVTIVRMRSKEFQCLRILSKTPYTLVGYELTNHSSNPLGGKRRQYNKIMPPELGLESLFTYVAGYHYRRF